MTARPPLRFPLDAEPATRAAMPEPPVERRPGYYPEFGEVVLRGERARSLLVAAVVLLEDREAELLESVARWGWTALRQSALGRVRAQLRTAHEALGADPVEEARVRAGFPRRLP